MEKRYQQLEASAWKETHVTTACPSQARNIYVAKIYSEGGESPSLNLEKEKKGM